MPTARENHMVLRNIAIRRVTYYGMAINIFLAIAKMVIGFFSHSRALTADGFHSLSDLITDVGLLAGNRLWCRPRDENHPYGHGRIEILVTILIGGLLGCVGIMIAYNGIDAIHENRVHSHPGWLGLSVLIVSILSKEFLYRWTVRVARHAHSTALEANAWHHRSDAFSSIPALCGVVGAMLKPEWWFLDIVGAVLVAACIIHAGISIVMPAVSKLLDLGVSPELGRRITEEALRVPGVESAHALRTRYIGGDVAVDLHVHVEPSLTVLQGHDIAEAVTEALCLRIDEVSDVLVHIEPAKTPTKTTLEATGKVIS